MVMLRYAVPVINEELTGEDSHQIFAVGGYLQGLRDAGIAEDAKIEPSGGKGAQVVSIQIDLVDIVRKEVIDKTLRETYKAIPIKSELDWHAAVDELLHKE